MLRCNYCEREFDKDEAKEVKTTYESYYGVANEFDGSTPLTLLICPYCKSEDIEEIEEDGSREEL